MGRDVLEFLFMRRMNSFHVRAVHVGLRAICEHRDRDSTDVRKLCGEKAKRLRAETCCKGLTVQRAGEVGPSVSMGSRSADVPVGACVEQPIVRLSAAELDALMGTVEVRQVALEECTLRNERRFEHGSDGMTRLYFGLCGSASLTTARGLSIAIAAHTLVVVPPVAGSLRQPGDVPRENRVMLAGNAHILCARFHAALGDVVDMFGGLCLPIVERFAEGDDIEVRLRLACAEFQERRPGGIVMMSLLMKQAIVLLLRRSLTSPSAWVERFAILRDHRVAKAFAEMATRPGAAHTVESLARTACLSRSTFMARFHELVGRAPMSVLRDLRMRRAAQQLRVNGISIGQIGQAAGYANNSGFIRAFRRAYGMDPREYRAQALLVAGDVAVPVREDEPFNESRSC